MAAITQFGLAPVEKAAPAALEELARQADRTGRPHVAAILRHTALLLASVLREEQTRQHP